jgi:hypothetical protein
MKSLAFILGKIRETDMQAKGVGIGAVSHGDLLKQLINEIGG